jgi:site-specific recombinase XerD
MRARLSAVFNAAFHAAGLDGSLHWLRHTFAMTMPMLVRLQRQAATSSDTDLNPLKVVQILLGHASIATTAIYLRCVEVHEDTARQHPPAQIILSIAVQCELLTASP